MEEIKVGEVFTKEITVTEQLLAVNVGSGNVRAYATPMMMCLMEEVSASCLKPFLDEGLTSVGIEISSTHKAATPLGMKVTAKATITAVDRNKVYFDIEASDEIDLIGKGTHVRFIVRHEYFETRTNEKLEQ